jgi:hypothetical protein
MLMTSVLTAILGVSLGPLARIEAIGRIALEKYFADAQQPRPSIIWLPEQPSARLQQQYWRWVSTADNTAILALPELEPRRLQTLVELASERCTGVQLHPLPADAPVRGLYIAQRHSSLRVESITNDASSPPAAAIVARARSWVQRTLTRRGLGFCPYTESSSMAAVGLEGAPAAPIAYHVSDARDCPALLEDFWSASAEMVDGGEERTSSIILAAPAWDGRWEEWYRDVFPLIEASVLAAGLGRSLGIVCFHPDYVTPSDEWLARHRFGHMHPTGRLRQYVDVHDADLSACSDDDALLWAASYQRRTPHAVINVLWSRQLELAEGKRKSSSLYTRNIRRAIEAGRDALNRAATDERRA